MTGAQIGLVGSTFLASAVEFVEAVTIVLAMGVTRGWRSALWGAGVALAVLAVVTAAAGYALTQWLPESLLQLVIGTLLLIFGLQWLRKAILRSSGLKAMHDEDAIFREEQEMARTAGDERRLGLDWLAFVVSFKGVLLEGLEVVFIVITFGLNASSIPLATVGALVALVMVVGVAAAVRRPLSNVPENTIKFAVGIMLSTFGTFWVVEGLGFFADERRSIEWPGGDWAIAVLLAVWIGLSYLTVRILKRAHDPRLATEGAP